MSQCTPGPGRIWPQLPPELAERIASCLSRNDVACTLRLVNKAAAEQFRGPQHTKVRLSLPTPAREFAWRWSVPGATRGLTHSQRYELLCLTASSGSIPNMEVALASAGRLPTRRVFHAAAAAGQLHMCEWLLQRGCPWDGALDAAALAGRRDACEWLIERRMFEPSRTGLAAYRYAARGGHVGLMEELLQRCRDDPGALQVPPQDRVDWEMLLIAVAEGCDLATLQRVHGWWLEAPGDGAQAGQQEEQQAGPQPPEAGAQILAAAARSPTPDWRDKVEWLEGQGCPRTELATRAASGRPDAVDRLEWLVQRGYPLDVLVVDKAAELGNLAALQYLHSNGFLLPSLRKARLAAARAGQLATLEWLLERSGPDAATEDGDEGLFDSAAESGNLEVVVWLHSRGFTWGERTSARAAAAGNELLLEWLAERGYPVQAADNNTSRYVAACSRDDPATLRYLRLGCPGAPPDRLFSEPSLCPPLVRLPALRALLAAGCPVDWKAAEAAVRSGRVGCYPAERDGVLALLAEGRARRQPLTCATPVVHIHTRTENEPQAPAVRTCRTSSVLGQEGCLAAAVAQLTWRLRRWVIRRRK